MRTRGGARHDGAGRVRILEREGALPIDYAVATTLAAHTGQFDLAVSSAVIYLIADLADHARQIRQALKGGGVYYATYTDYRGNPSLATLRAEIDRHGALPMQLHSLDDIALAFQEEGFSVSIRRLGLTDYIPLHLPDRFLQSVEDRLLYEYEQAYIFRFVAPSA